MRREPTEAEAMLWRYLRDGRTINAKFRRQQPIGPYITDLISFEHRLIVEIDGGQHADDEAQQHDEQRTGWLMEQNFQVLRFWNNDVTSNIEGVLETIRSVTSDSMREHIAGSHPHPAPSPVEGEGKTTPLGEDR